MDKRISELKSKLETLACSSIDITIRRNYSERPATHVIRASVTDRISGHTPTFYIYFTENNSVKARIENQYSYLYESFDRRSYPLEHLVETILNEWCITAFNDEVCEK
jgi:hypothetical protein